MNEVAKSEKQKEESIKKTTDIFEISSPFEQALPNMIKESFPFDILNLFDTKGTPIQLFKPIS